MTLKAVYLFTWKEHWKLPAKHVTPAAHEAVHHQAGNCIADGCDLDPVVCLLVDELDGFPRLAGVDAVYVGAAGGVQGGASVRRKVDAANPLKNRNFIIILFL